MASFAVFGTTAVLLVTDPAAADQARSIAEAELAAIDLACSRFRPDSEISFLNKNAGRLTPVSELFAELIAEALRAAELTGGDVDPTVGQALVAAGYDRDFGEIAAAGAGRTTGADGTAAADGTAGASGGRRAAGAVPGWRNVLLDRASGQVQLARGAQLDLGSTAKAWAADRCADLIASQLSCGVLVSLGGDVAVAGPPPDDGWPVKATDDHADPGDAPGQVITIRDGGLATSSTTVRTWEAGGKRMHHIIDPRTGSPVASPWRTASVAAATCLDANIASTAAIIKGEQALAWLTELGLPARLVTQSGTITTTPTWPPAPPGPPSGPPAPAGTAT